MSDLRRRYDQAKSLTQARYGLYLKWVRIAKESRAAYLKEPTRANLKHFRQARKVRTRKLHLFRDARRERDKLKREIRDSKLRLRALEEARKLIGVMEQGGNNRGREVEKIIREGGGLPGQAWCGWFCATVYKRAGSLAVLDWRVGAVRLWSFIHGVRRTSNPRPGDVVRFTFDHIGIFEKWIDANTIQTIEGNTGAAGSVSDSTTGGDGVRRKRRDVSLVNDYLRVTR